MINKKWLKISMFIPFIGMISNCIILFIKYLENKSFPYEKILGTLFFPGISAMVVFLLVQSLGVYVFIPANIGDSLLFLRITVLCCGIVMNLVFYLYYKKNFAKYVTQDTNNQDNDTQK